MGIQAGHQDTGGFDAEPGLQFMIYYRDRFKKAFFCNGLADFFQGQMGRCQSDA